MRTRTPRCARTCVRVAAGRPPRHRGVGRGVRPRPGRGRWHSVARAPVPGAHGVMGDDQAPALPGRLCASRCHGRRRHTLRGLAIAPARHGKDQLDRYPARRPQRLDRRQVVEAQQAAVGDANGALEHIPIRSLPSVRFMISCRSLVAATTSTMSNTAPRISIPGPERPGCTGFAVRGLPGAHDDTAAQSVHAFRERVILAKIRIQPARCANRLMPDCRIRAGGPMRRRWHGRPEGVSAQAFMQRLAVAVTPWLC